MARYETTQFTDWPQQAAFEYLADFNSVSDWDPSITSARRIGGSALEEDAVYEIEMEFYGRTTEFTYETLEIERPHRIVLRSSTKALTSTDTMRFAEDERGRTAVTYVAEIELHGPLRLIDPIFQALFNRVGDRAAEGLAKRLALPPPTRVDGEVER